MNDPREVNFNEYCPKCKFSDTAEFEEPCNECMFYPANIDSRRPKNYIPQYD